MNITLHCIRKFILYNQVTITLSSQPLYFQEKPYSFNYSILDEETGISHAREESSDDRGVVRGSYEVKVRLQPEALINVNYLLPASFPP